MIIDFGFLFWLENAALTAGVLIVLNAKWGNWDGGDFRGALFATMFGALLWPVTWVVGVVALIVTGIGWLAPAKSAA